MDITPCPFPQMMREEAEKGTFKGVLERTMESTRKWEDRMAAIKAEQEERDNEMVTFRAREVPADVLEGAMITQRYVGITALTVPATHLLRACVQGDTGTACSSHQA